MIGSTEQLVDLLLRAEEAIGAALHPMIVAGAGATIATCVGQDTSGICTWSGLIETALREAAANPRTGTEEERKSIEADADLCRTATTAEELIALCDKTCALYQRANLDISRWIFSKFNKLEGDLAVRIKGGYLPPLLNEIRNWQASVGAVVATTNYDRLLTTAGCGDPKELHEDPLANRTSAALADILDGAHNVIHLHGRHDIDSSAVFSGAQYKRLMDLNIIADSFARRLFNTTLPIFVGCGAGLADQDLSLLIGDRSPEPTENMKSEYMKCAVVLHLAGDLKIEALMKETPFDTKCIAISFGSEHSDLAPFLNKVRNELLDRGFRGRRPRRGNLLVEAWLRRRRAVLKDVSLRTSIPPIVLGREVREISLRAFVGALLRPRIPAYELQAVDPAIEVPGADAALHEDARFDPAPLTLLDTVPFAVLLGDGGAGKTALTKLLVAQASEKDPDLITATLRVAEYFRAHQQYLDNAEERGANLWEFLVADLRAPVIAGNSPPPHDDLERAFLAAAEHGSVLVILDGLDEVSNQSDRAGIVSEVIALHERLASAQIGGRSGKYNRLILTSRFSGYRTAPVAHVSAQHFVLSPLLPDQVSRLFDIFFDSLRDEAVAEGDVILAKREKLAQALAECPLAKTAWIDTPLMAILVASVFLAEDRLPQSREALFDRIVERSCAFVISHAHPGPPALSEYELRRALEEAAYRIFFHGTQDSLSRTSLGDAFIYLRPHADDADIVKLVAIATSDTSLLRERGTNYFSFIHRGVLEYLCGCRLHVNAVETAERADNAVWRQPASFAAGMALRKEARDALIEAVSRTSSIANGYRPLLCLLRGALYSGNLSPAAARAVAQATITGAADLVRHVSGIDDHRPLRDLMRAVSIDLPLAAAFEDVLKERLVPSPTEAQALGGALLVCEGLTTASLGLSVAIDGAVSGAAMELRGLGERVQRLLIRRYAEANKDHSPGQLHPFAAAVAKMRSPATGADLAAWRRGIAALAGGIVDLGHAEVQPVRMRLAQFLSASDERRNILLFTLAEPLRALALDQQEAIARAILEKSGQGRSLQDVIRELNRRPDIIYGLAFYLDAVAEPLLKDKTRTPRLDEKYIYHTPRLAGQVVDNILRGNKVEALIGARSLPVDARHEQAILAAIVGLPADRDAGPALALATRRVADGAVRSLIEVETILSVRGGNDMLDHGHILAEAVVDLKLALRLPAKFDIHAASGEREYALLNFREMLGRTLTGEGLDPAEDLHGAMVILDVLDPTKRIGGLVELGHSRLVGTGHSTWDFPPLPLPHLHVDQRLCTTLGDAIDNLEVCPSAISAFRSETLRGLALIEHPDAAEIRLELEAALSQDWGAQAVIGEAHRFARDVWEDRGLDAMAAARAAHTSAWKARALARLLRLASAGTLEEREREIVTVIEAVSDPFKQVLAYELLAERAHPARAQAYALCAFDRLIVARPFPPPLFGRKMMPGLANPELCARAFARLSVWLPLRQRDRALVAAVGLATQIVNLWSRTVLLRALAPYARHSSAAKRRWDQAVAKLPHLHRAHCAGESGAVLRHCVDVMLSDVPELANGEADPIVAYALLRDARRRLGDELTSWEILERADANPAGAEAVRRAFQSAEVPRLSSAGLLTLRAFCEAGMADVASFVIARVSRHPPGTAAVLAQADPDLSMLVRARARGMDATSAPAVAGALVGKNDAHRALARAIVEAAEIAVFKNEEDKPFAPFTRRRVTVEGLDTLIAFAKTITPLEGRGVPLTNANRYFEHLVFETARQADHLMKLAQGSGPDAHAARHVLARIDLATPQFLKRLVAAPDQGDDLGPVDKIAQPQLD